MYSRGLDRSLSLAVRCFLPVVGGKDATDKSDSSFRCGMIDYYGVGKRDKPDEKGKDNAKDAESPEERT